MSDSVNISKKKKSPRVDALEAEVTEMRETVLRIYDAQKMALGALIGVAGLLILFAWYFGHRTYEGDMRSISLELTKANENRYQIFDRKLADAGAEQSKIIDQKMNAKWQQLRSQISSLSGVSNTNLAELDGDLTRKIILVRDNMERKYGDAFGIIYWDQAVKAVNTRRMFPEATEYFLAAALAYWRGEKEADVNKCLSRLFEFCFPFLRQQDLILRPEIEEKYALLLSVMEQQNTGGKWQVAIVDMRRHMQDVRQRIK